MQPPSLKVEALNLWRGEAWLVRNLSFTASAGELMHVAGPNGSGKTTLLRALAGLTQAESGTIAWGGTTVGTDPEFFADVAWLGHRDGLKPELSARENLRAYAGLSARRTGDIDTALADAGIGAVADLQVRVMSAGQQRRVALARVFASAARIWILDEPFANLDVAGQQWGLQQVRKHIAGGGLALLTTHLVFDEASARRIELGGT